MAKDTEEKPGDKKTEVKTQTKSSCGCGCIPPMKTK
jgi:hypothetical protein